MFMPRKGGGRFCDFHAAKCLGMLSTCVGRVLMSVRLTAD